MVHQLPPMCISPFRQSLKTRVFSLNFSNNRQFSHFWDFLCRNVHNPHQTGRPLLKHNRSVSKTLVRLENSICIFMYFESKYKPRFFQNTDFWYMVHQFPPMCIYPFLQSLKTRVFSLNFFNNRQFSHFWHFLHRNVHPTDQVERGLWDVYTFIFPLQANASRCPMAASQPCFPILLLSKIDSIELPCWSNCWTKDAIKYSLLSNRWDVLFPGSTMVGNRWDVLTCVSIFSLALSWTSAVSSEWCRLGLMDKGISGGWNCHGEFNKYFFSFQTVFWIVYHLIAMSGQYKGPKRQITTPWQILWTQPIQVRSHSILFFYCASTTHANEVFYLWPRCNRWGVYWHNFRVCTQPPSSMEWLTYMGGMLH